ncbi:MAG: hypothetical protein IJD33_02190, partial [Clostridia bacterium]|nr:hypothetical protein [Clostridia bacterium]
VLREDLVYYDAKDFDVYGVQYEDGLYRRMPNEYARTVSENVGIIAKESAGGRIRFATDSPFVAIFVKYAAVAKVPNYSFTATMGFDLYAGKRYIGAFVPALDSVDDYEGVLDICGLDGVQTYTLNLPICSQIKEIRIGVKAGSVMTNAPKYTLQTPVVFYGSSVTQGACASRPGNTYANMLSRALDCDYVNLGFWGNALGEERMAEYIANMDASLFVYDYDYNAPNVTHLQATHEKMFKIIRAAQPNLPIIMLSAPICYPSEVDKERENVIKATYENALAKGDKNVAFLSGSEMISLIADMALADNIHPADVGFAVMAKRIGEKIKQMIKG